MSREALEKYREINGLYSRLKPTLSTEDDRILFRTVMDRRTKLEEMIKIEKERRASAIVCKNSLREKMGRQKSYVQSFFGRWIPSEYRQYDLEISQKEIDEMDFVVENCDKFLREAEGFMQPSLN